MSNRVRIWRNLRRVAAALDLLHDQGLLHRNLDTWSVLTAGGEEPDFQLTGFEWSMRIIGPAGASRGRKRATVEVNSFNQDWLLYGLLAAELLDARPERLTTFSLSASDVAEHLTAAEVRLLRNAMGIDKLERLDGSVLVGLIDEVLADLLAEAAGREAKLQLVFGLGQRSRLSVSIRSASHGEIEIDDLDAQAQFIEADLAASPLLQAVQLPDQTSPRLLLQGHILSYWVGEYRHPRSNATASWEFAYCDSTARQLPAPINVKAKQTLDSNALEFLTVPEAADKYPRVRGRVRTWDSIRKALDTKKRRGGQEDEIHRALVLTLFLDALYSATDVFPVEVGPSLEAPNGDGVLMHVQPRLDSDRERLSEALGLRAPARRLRDALIGDGLRRQEWTLTDSPTLGEGNPTDTDWRFERETGGGKKPQLYTFRGAEPPPLLRAAFLVPADSVGRDVQFRRQLKALAALKEHRELLEMLSDPRQRILDTHEKVAADEDLGALDAAKRDALVDIFATLPLYLVQGPPGVGKTRLVRELVRRRLREEPTSRLLLAAQSNAAVDHLLKEVAPVASDEDETLVIRCRASERLEERDRRYEVQVRAREMLADLEQSDLARSAPPKLQRALRQLQVAAAPRPRTADGRSQNGYGSAAYAARAFEGVVLRAANLVFATTNSAELERLTEERGQFDWSIIEEAGKATGGELLAAQLLSHRRLMIGDHKQLPAFGADQMRKLLEVPENVKSALVVGKDFIGRSLRSEATDELLDELEEEENDDLPELCSRAIGLVTMFQTLLETEFDTQRRRPQARKIAKQLNLQHRMHPAIASIVSRCFYEIDEGQALETHEDAAKRFKNDDPPFSSKAPDRLPISPVVVVDMPSVQGTPGLGRQEMFPRWINPTEVDAVTAALGVLEPGLSSPTLAVLSPYTQQVNRIRAKIADLRGGALSNLAGFQAATQSGEFVHTVDSFQGSEADIVLVSLVRNNDHSDLRNALGFLSDPRRMNVLLSRARWQLVLIGSTAFLKEVVKIAAASGDGEKVEFLKRLLEKLDQDRDATVAWRSAAELMGTGG